MNMDTEISLKATHILELKSMLEREENEFLMLVIKRDKEYMENYIADVPDNVFNIRGNL